MKALDRAGSLFLRAILRRMKALNLNQSALARRMNVSRAYISKVLSGDVNFSFATACRFAKALEMDFLPGLAPKGATMRTFVCKGQGVVHVDKPEVCGTITASSPKCLLAVSRNADTKGVR